MERIATFPKLLAVSLLVAVTVAGAGGRPASSGVPAEDASAVPGSGQAVAELFQLDPAIGNLALTIRIGTSLAGHQNAGASSEARSVDMGFIGDILTGEGCDGGESTIPPGTLPDSTYADSAVAEDAAGNDGGVDGLVAVRAQADATPSAAARSELLPIGLPGLVEIRGGRSEASSTGQGHVAHAATAVGRLEIAGGLVALEGMRWEATSRLEPERQTTSDFSLERVVIGGVAVPLPAADQLQAVQRVLDPVLGPLGIALHFPEVRSLDDGVELTPLSVGVVPGELRDGVLGPLLGAVQPARAQLDEFLLGLDCGNATYITVLDILLGSITGAGYTAVDIGGVTARSSELEFTSFLGGTGGPTTIGSLPESTPAIDGDVDVTPTFGGVEPDVAESDAGLPLSTSSPQGPQPLGDEHAVAQRQEGERGGPLLLIGLAGLLGCGAAAAGDRKRMRRAQRSRPMTE